MISHASEKFAQCGSNSHGRSSARHEPSHVIGSAAGVGRIDEDALLATGSTIASSRVVPSGIGTR